MADIKAIAGYKLFDEDSNSPTPLAPASLEKTGVTVPEPPLDLSKLVTRKIELASSSLRYAKWIMPLAIIQICLGAIAIGANAVVIADTQVLVYYYKMLGIDGSGIWGGIISIAAGIFGIALCHKSRGCRIIVYLVLSIIAATSAAIAVACNSFWMPLAENFAYNGYSSYGRFISGDKSPLVGCALGITVALANVIVSVVSASLTCVNAPCCCGNAAVVDSSAGVRIVYVAVPIAFPTGAITEALSKEIGAYSNKAKVAPQASALGSTQHPGIPD